LRFWAFIGHIGLQVTEFDTHAGEQPNLPTDPQQCWPLAQPVLKAFKTVQI